MYFPPSLIVFVLLYMMSFILVINSDDWFLIWIGLELNMLSFLLLIYKQNSINYIESCLKYFFVQSLGSALLMGFLYLSSYKFIYLGSLILSYKMGAGPFYFWFPSICAGLGWDSCFVLMSFQKLIPLMLMVFFISWIFFLLIVISLIFGAFGSLNQKNMKQLMAFSSIHHLGWMMLCISVDSSVWLYYLIMYSFIIFPIFYIMMNYNSDDLLAFHKWKAKRWFIVSMLSMAGMPPFLGFFLKWIAFYFIMKMDFFMIMFMIMMSVIMFYVYIRILYDFMLGLGIEIGWNYSTMLNMYLVNVDLFIVMGFFMGMFMLLFILV